MSVYEKKAWIDSISEYPTRRKLTNVNTSEERIVDVSRQEGTVSVAGSPFNATTMNDLETRVDNVVTECEDNFQSAIDRIYQLCIDNGITPSARTPQAIARAIAQIRAGGNATANDILSGKSLYSGKTLISGNITNRGAWVGTTSSRSSVSIPAGYHNGNGYVKGADAWNAGRSQGRADKSSHTLKIDCNFIGNDNIAYAVYLDGNEITSASGNVGGCDIYAGALYSGGLRISRIEPF